MAHAWNLEIHRYVIHVLPMLAIGGIFVQYCVTVQYHPILFDTFRRLEWFQILSDTTPIPPILSITVSRYIVRYHPDTTPILLQYIPLIPPIPPIFRAQVASTHTVTHHDEEKRQLTVH